MRLSRLFFVASVVLATTILQAPLSASPVDEQIAKLRSQWAQELRTKQLDAILDLYAPDAVFLSTGESRVTGRAAIHTLFKNVMAMFTSDLQFHSVNMDVSGELAYDSGDYSETLVPTAGGPNLELKGSYIIVYKRAADGKWRIVQQVWTLAKGEAPRVNP